MRNDVATYRLFTSLVKRRPSMLHFQDHIPGHWILYWSCIRQESIEIHWTKWDKLNEDMSAAHLLNVAVFFSNGDGSGHVKLLGEISTRFPSRNLQDLGWVGQISTSILVCVTNLCAPYVCLSCSVCFVVKNVAQSNKGTSSQTLLVVVFGIKGYGKSLPKRGVKQWKPLLSLWNTSCISAFLARITFDSQAFRAVRKANPSAWRFWPRCQLFNGVEGSGLGS